MPAANIRQVRLFILIFIVVYFILLQIVSNHDSLYGFSYWLIPDSITNYELTRGLVTGEFLLGDFLASAGVPLFYSFFYYFGIFGFIIANVGILTIGARYYGLVVFYASLLLFPHYLQLLVLPSKDMMVLGIYFATIFHLLRGNWLTAVIISICSYFIRDGAIFVLLPLIAVAFLIKKQNIRPLRIVIASLLFGIVVFAMLEVVASELFVVSRNLYAAKENASDAVRNLPPGISYLARVFFNLTNMAFRLTFVDVLGRISIASIFMYISGVSSLVCAIVATNIILKSTDQKLQIVATCFFVSLFVISLNPFVQGRYQLPMSIVASIILFSTVKPKKLIRLYGFVILASFIFRLIYWVLDIPFPELEVNPVDLLGLVNG